MRSKEEAHDYRYFPEPDLPPLVVDAGRIERIRAAMPELPDARRQRFVEAYGLPEYDAGQLTQSRDSAQIRRPRSHRRTDRMIGDDCSERRLRGNSGHAPLGDIDGLAPMAVIRTNTINTLRRCKEASNRSTTKRSMHQWSKWSRTAVWSFCPVTPIRSAYRLIKETGKPHVTSLGLDYLLLGRRLGGKFHRSPS